MQVVIFTLQKEQFAVETARVQSISNMMEVTKVPRAPQFIKGLINLRGNIIPLFDLNLLLDNNNLEQKQKNIIIISMDTEFIAISVDKVDEVLNVEENMIENINEKDKKDYIKGIINFKNRIVTLIDIDKLVLN